MHSIGLTNVIVAYVLCRHSAFMCERASDDLVLILCVGTQTEKLDVRLGYQQLHLLPFFGVVYNRWMPPSCVSPCAPSPSPRPLVLSSSFISSSRTALVVILLSYRTSMVSLTSMSLLQSVSVLTLFVLNL